MDDKRIIEDNLPLIESTRKLLKAYWIMSLFSVKMLIFSICGIIIGYLENKIAEFV